MKRIFFAAVLAAAFHGLLLTLKIHRTSQTPPAVGQRTVEITLAAATPSTRAKKETKKEKRFTAPDPVPAAKKTMPAKRAKRVDRNRKLTKKKTITKRISHQISKKPVGKTFKTAVKKTTPLKNQSPPPLVNDPGNDAGLQGVTARRDARELPAGAPESLTGVEPTDRNGQPKQLKIKEAIPAYQKNPPPRYPRMARRRGYEGTVLIKVLVNRDGKVNEVKVIQSSGYDVLDRSALNTVKDWSFEPGMKGDRAVEMWVVVPIRFALK